MKVAIVSAMSIELEHILHQYQLETMGNKNQQLFYQFTVGEFEFTLATTGIGKVNAAIHCQQLIHQYQPDVMVNIGIAGGIASDVQLYDIIIGSHVTHHDVRLSQMKNTFPFQEQFKANQPLYDFIKQQLPDAIPSGIASGESFITDTASHHRIQHELNCTAVDMEASALAQTCFINHVPFISIKCLSDLANSDATTAYRINEQEACTRLGKAVCSVLDQLT
ncbi:5'-methylthioadenosine/S-adenosylhomocysteine nucleosidase [Vagococcus zengguangii]|uniref:adenosylhomocysteine nucleosidase n=1 Tax=Vagococcus zengguangii TaxID=2571750 RepID=A0A4D7CQ86_9ENTE|nr:5'-methylthioadenosine/S-adenosylhomocysteine nucleosidase [Vagococcus zengguangii]QCI86229.1 5'-methylthioadenosine/S-adenosylhomocysteine nucleosidase [Vagococcus zengguangii]TLG79662.1 5'-methylthioadenosine/S-adenosylhomocysteine nucleosidase [Vagococcus zengguangii]